MCTNPNPKNPWVVTLSVAVAATLACAGPTSTRAQQAQPDIVTLASQVALIQTQLEEVRQENEQLRQQLALLQQKAEQAPPVAPSPTLSPAPTAAPSAAPLPAAERYPVVTFQLLGDVDYVASNIAGQHNSFLIGDICPLVTAHLTDHSSVLGDFTIASDHSEVQVERLLARYTFSDFFNIEAGRFHTMIGYYSDTYHNGTYFQTTVDRPAIYDFEDDGGILPIHSDGLSIDGEIPSGDFNLHYVAQVANERDYAFGGFESYQSSTGPKAFNLALFSRPEAMPGLQLGGSAYYAAGVLPNLDQTILAAYAVYRTPTWEWLNESVAMLDTVHDRRTYVTNAYYSQFSYKLGAFRPYLRLEWRDTALADPIIALVAQNDSYRTQTAGIRYDFSPMMALKVELERNVYDHSSSTAQETTQLTFYY